MGSGFDASELQSCTRTTSCLPRVRVSKQFYQFTSSHLPAVRPLELAFTKATAKARKPDRTADRARRHIPAREPEQSAITYEEDGINSRLMQPPSKTHRTSQPKRRRLDPSIPKDEVADSDVEHALHVKSVSRSDRVSQLYDRLMQSELPVHGHRQPSSRPPQRTHNQEYRPKTSTQAQPILKTTNSVNPDSSASSLERTQKQTLPTSNRKQKQHAQPRLEIPDSQSLRNSEAGACLPFIP